MVNQYTRRITGFEANSLVNGKERETVRKEVKQLLQGKLVIIYNGGADFRALDIDQSDFKFFDLQEVFQKWNGKFNRLGNKHFEPIGLRHLFYHYLKIDIQSGCHSALEDARATMQLFKDNYLELALLNKQYSRSFNFKDGIFYDIVRLP
jgi:DNA polymerase III epsilon subunit-like protein